MQFAVLDIHTGNRKKKKNEEEEEEEREREYWSLDGHSLSGRYAVHLTFKNRAPKKSTQMVSMLGKCKQLRG